MIIELIIITMIIIIISGHDSVCTLQQTALAKQ